MTASKHIFVYADWAHIHGPVLIGEMLVTTARGNEVLSFAYDKDWLKNGAPILLDPKLHFAPGPQYAETAFGILLDSAPDRWGRTLIQRREAIRAKNEDRHEQPLFDSDYLMAVDDTSRIGGLRFKISPDGPFQSDDQTLSTPPFHALRELESAAFQIEQNHQDNAKFTEWLRLLLAPGTSLGGARPKANVIDPEGNLWIAKFPSRNDEWDIGIWENVAYTLAQQAGLNTVKTQVGKYSSHGHTFLIQRFDRLKRQRIHFASALNLLGYQDGDGSDTGVSYLELVDLIIRISEQPDDDLEELWKRIVFNICIQNTDDHLRNHGFILGTQGWKLSPVYDLNPNPWGAGLALNISESSNALDLDLAIEVAPYFRLTPKRQDDLIKHILETTKEWERVAKHAKIISSEISRMRSAFEAS